MSFVLKPGAVIRQFVQPEWLYRGNRSPYRDYWESCYLRTGYRCSLNTTSKIGVFRNSTHLFYLNYNGNGVWNGASADRQYNFGITGDIPVTGDWNNDSKSDMVYSGLQRTCSISTTMGLGCGTGVLLINSIISV